MSFIAVAAGVGVVGAVYKGIQGGKQQRMANAIHPNDPVYQQSPYAANQLAAVSNAYNGRMGGASYAENNIDSNQANSAAGVERNSSNGFQNLAVLSGLQGNTNTANLDLAAKEANNKQALLGELGQANQGMTSEADKIYNDQLRNYNNSLNAKNALQSAAWKNQSNMVSDIGTSLIGGAGAINKMIGGGANSTGYSAPQASGPYNPAMYGSTGNIDPNYNPFT